MAGQHGSVQAKGKDLVLKPVDEVFDAIVDPAALSGFFISRGSGPLQEGQTVTWAFDDVGGSVDVTVTKVRRPEQLSFEWPVTGRPTQVEMTFQAVAPDKTIVEIAEADFPLTEEGVDLALEQTAGWTDFLCCMKGYLQHGVNLRQGREALH
jgi:uncharacterized protein YndB with AHSA1/START domain